MDGEPCTETVDQNFQQAQPVKLAASRFPRPSNTFVTFPLVNFALIQRAKHFDRNGLVRRGLRVWEIWLRLALSPTYLIID